MALQRHMGRRIAIAVITSSALVLLGSFFVHASARPTIVSLIVVNAAAVVAHLLVGRRTSVHVIPGHDGILIARGKEVVRLIPYEAISTITDERCDVCVILREGRTVRLGIDADADRIEAVRSLRATLSRAAKSR
jgi:hypothetical protein